MKEIGRSGKQSGQDRPEFRVLGKAEPPEQSSVKLRELVVPRRLVPEVFLSWDFAWRDGRSAGWESEVSENFHDHLVFNDSGDGFHFTAAVMAVIHIESENS